MQGRNKPMSRWAIRVPLIVLMFAVGAFAGLAVYHLLLGQTKDIQAHGVDETTRLIEQGLKSFDIVAIENIARVLFKADHVSRLQVVTGSGFVVFDGKKSDRGVARHYDFTEVRENGDLRRVGTVRVEVDHDPNAVRNIAISCLTGGLLSFLLVRLIFSARSLRRELAVREASENALREQEENSRILLDSLTEAVIAVDSAGCVRQMNSVAEHMTNWHLAEAAGVAIDSVFCITHGEANSTLQGSTALGVIDYRSRIQNERATLVARGGAEHLVSYSIAPIIGNTRAVPGVVVVFRDVGVEMKAQQTIQEMEKMQAIGVLASGIAHDYNNLLGIISAAAEVIRVKEQGSLTDTSSRLLDIIVKTTRRGADLTSRLLTFGGKLPADQRLVSLHASIENVVMLLKRTVDKRFDVLVQLDARDDRIEGGATLIENVLLNIALNASQAMKGDRGTFLIQTNNVVLMPTDDAVRMHHAPIGKCVKITLSDSGVGIPEENISRIFEPFFTNRRGGGGFGLGLWTVYNTVREHGGTIHVESTVGMGTKFVIHFPISLDAVTLPQCLPRIASPTNKTIMVVDDEDGMRSTLAEMLNALHCRSRLASGGEEAIRIFKEEHAAIDAVMMDLNMPGMSGEDAIMEIRRIDPSIPVVISTGYSGESSNEGRRFAERCLFLKKPYMLADLASILAQLLGEDTARDQVRL